MYKGKYFSANAPAAPKSKTGTIVFYSIYGAVVLGLILALVLGMNALKSWLIRYESSQPGNKSQQVFTELFAQPDWNGLYALAGIEDTAYEGSESYAAYMTQKLQGKTLTYQETSAGLSGDRKYLVYLGSEKIASYTLKGSDAEQSGITDWELDKVELFFTRTHTVTVAKLPEHTVYINGVPLNDSHTIRTVSTGAESMLPEGVHGYRMEYQLVNGLLIQPNIEVKDADGNPVAMAADEKGILTPVLPQPIPMSEEEKALIVSTGEAYAKYCIRAVTNAQLAEYFDSKSDYYKELIQTSLFVQGYDSFRFLDDKTSVSDFTRYNENLFSARIQLTMEIKRLSGRQTKYLEMNTTYFFTKLEKGWRVTDITNVPVHEKTELVRLRFFAEGSLLDSQMVNAHETGITLPTVSAPEGQILKGWAKQETNDQGQITMTVVFTPDETGKVTLPEDTTLEPMDLYPVFEKGGNA